MPSRRWDDPWQKYPASVPLPVEGGVATSRQRGPMATTWWSRRFVEVLESYGLGARMQRGRRYARTGQVVEVEVSPAAVAAQVQGSRPRPYLVTATLNAPGEQQWAQVLDAMRAKVGFVARLLDGEVPAELEEVFADAGVALFPAAWSDIRATCSCPDWENPCKHIAAVLYLLADRLDTDPWLVLLLRGRGRDELLDALAVSAGAVSDGGSSEVAPWWPFGPGTLPDAYRNAADLGATGVTASPDRPDAILDTMEPFDVAVGPAPLVELVRPLYGTFIDWLAPP